MTLTPTQILPPLLSIRLLSIWLLLIQLLLIQPLPIQLLLPQLSLPTYSGRYRPSTTCQLSLDEAMRYLQRESLVMPPGTPLGIVQVCHRGQPLGLMKNVGSRANNLYPKEWRIRSSHLTPHSIL